QWPQTAVAGGARVDNGVGAPTDRAGSGEVEVGERVDELRHRRVPGDRGVDAEGEEVILARRFLGIEDTEDPPTTAVDRAHEAEGQRGPPIAHDERVVLLVERDGRLDHHLADACAAVMGEVAVQRLDPRFGREHQRDGRFHERHRAVGSKASDVPTRSSDCGAVPAAGRAPVVRVIETSPSAMAAARSCDCAAETATVTVNGLADSPIPPRPRASTASTSASATMIETWWAPAKSTSTRSPAPRRPPTARAGSIGMLIARSP